MLVKIVYLGLVRSRIGKNEEQYDVAESTSLADLLKALAEIYGEKLYSLLLTINESRLDTTVLTMVNGISIDPLKGSDVTLKEGDIVTLSTLISGG